MGTLPGRGGSEVYGLEERVLQTNPILESFGNAMTTRTWEVCDGNEMEMRCGTNQNKSLKLHQDCSAL